MASKRAVRRKACEGKRSYYTYRAAMAEVYRWRQKADEQPLPGTEMLPYRCSFCHQFHLGHPVTQLRRTRRAQFP
jgi:hypothetical protein